MTLPLYQRIAVIGCGLIGGSIVRAAKARGLAGDVVVCEVDDAYRARLAELKVADRLTGDPVEAVRDADLVVIATPPATIEAVARLIGPAMKPGSTLTDVGGAKETVGEAMAAAARAEVFVVPGHPIAGTEHSGPDAGLADLFDNRWTILCPRASDQAGYAEAVARLTRFWEAMGARVEAMDARHHDKVLAVTSHVPHMIAYTLVGTAAEIEAVSEGEVMKFSAGGFRDMTRVAASDPAMWRDVFRLNREMLLEVFDLFRADLDRLADAVRAGDDQAVEDLLTQGRAIRRALTEMGPK